MPSSNPTYTALIPDFLPPRTSLPHTLIMIVLDWTRPWTFVQELETWLQLIDINVADGGALVKCIDEEAYNGVHDRQRVALCLSKRYLSIGTSTLRPVL